MKHTVMIVLYHAVQLFERGNLPADTKRKAGSCQGAGLKGRIALCQVNGYGVKGCSQVNGQMVILQGDLMRIA